MLVRVGGLDAAFVALESGPNHFHVAQACLFDPSTSGEEHSFERVRQLIIDRLDRLPPFRRCLVHRPGGLAPPMWMEDPDFDIDDHLRPVRLLRPGGIHELADFISVFISRPLDLSRPPWEMAIIEGLDDGMVASVTKIHHSAVDGLSGAELTANLLDLEPDAPAPPPAPSEWKPDQRPSTFDQLMAVGRHQAQLPLTTARAVRELGGAVGRLARRNRTPGAIVPPGAFSAPKTPFDTRMSGRRAVAFTRLDMDDFDSVRHAFDVKHNDVFLAACAGAFRELLMEQDELPDRDLVAAVPVSVRNGDADSSVVNQLSTMLVGLATTEDDPKSRLGLIAAGSRAGKEQDRLLGPNLLATLSGVISPAAGRVLGELVSLTGLMHRPRPLVNVVISNFPGPNFPLYFAGGTLVAPYPLGPIIDGAAINITAQSYMGGLHVGIAVDAVTGPDPWEMAAALEDSLGQLAKMAA